MVEPVLIETMGDSVNLRLLNFFIENPFDSYSIYQISKLVEISRNSIYKYLPQFEEKDYLIKERIGSRDLFRLNRSNKIIELIDRFVNEAGNTYIGSNVKNVMTSYEKYVTIEPCMGRQVTAARAA